MGYLLFHFFAGAGNEYPQALVYSQLFGYLAQTLVFPFLSHSSHPFFFSQFGKQYNPYVESNF